MSNEIQSSNDQNPLTFGNLTFELKTIGREKQQILLKFCKFAKVQLQHHSLCKPDLLGYTYDESIEAIYIYLISTLSLLL
jgi:hypothetical protein